MAEGGGAAGPGLPGALGSAPWRAAAERRRSAGHCPPRAPGITFRSRGTSQAPGWSRLFLSPSSLKNSGDPCCGSTVIKCSAPTAEVSSRINFSPRHNEIHLKTFAAVIVFDLLNCAKKFPHSRDFNHSGIRSSLFSSQKTQLIKHKQLSHKSSSHTRDAFLALLLKNHRWKQLAISSLAWCPDFSIVKRPFLNSLSLFEKRQRASLRPYSVGLLNLFSVCIREHKMNM